MERIEIGGLSVVTALHGFVTEEVLPGTGVSVEAFWSGFGALVHDLAPRNHALLRRRDALQTEIDAWLSRHPGRLSDPAAYRAFLESIGYLLPDPPPFTIQTSNVDHEITSVAGPQLVVPITNARYALNAANARWAAFTTRSMVPMRFPRRVARSVAAVSTPNARRGVIRKARALLDEAAPLAAGSHADAAGYAVVDGVLKVALANGAETGCAIPSASSAIAGMPRDLARSCCATTGCTWSC